MIRVVLPYHLRTLARVDGEVRLDPQERPTQRSVLDALRSGDKLAEVRMARELGEAFRSRYREAGRLARASEPSPATR